MSRLSLLYHDVGEGEVVPLSGFPGMIPGRYKLSMIEFSAHLAGLSNAGLHFSSDIVDPEGSLITFDDGGASTPYIADALEAFGWRGCFFIVTDLVGSRGFASWPEIADIASRGHLVGSHSATHPERLNSLSYDSVRHEWTRSCAELSERLASPIVCASVPGGFWSRSVAQAAADAGIQALFTSRPSLASCRMGGVLNLGRFCVTNSRNAEWVVNVARGSGTARAISLAGWLAKELAKTVGGKRYLSLRRMILRE
jgi:peptidoglycan/xylan/chitin deacetylase (PgdA/CDA1 family)